MGKTDAWMPVWIGDYLADTQHLTRDEHGGYWLLLMSYWRAGGPLSDDDKRLAAIVKASPREWKVIRPTLAEFFVVADGVWSHKRAEAELAESRIRKDKAQAKAKAAAKARWPDSPSNPSGNAPSIPPGTPQAKHEECPSPSPSPSSLRSEEKAATNVAAKKRNTRLPTDFYPNETGINAATGLSLVTELDAFRNHHAAKGSLMADWQAAWRTWCGNAHKFAKPASGASGIGRRLTHSQMVAERRIATLDGLTGRNRSKPNGPIHDFIDTDAHFID